MSRLELPPECPAPPGPRGSCTGTNFEPVEGGAPNDVFTNVQVGAGSVCGMPHTVLRAQRR